MGDGSFKGEFIWVLLLHEDGCESREFAFIQLLGLSLIQKIWWNKSMVMVMSMLAMN